jgi:hypothetical protein
MPKRGDAKNELRTVLFRSDGRLGDHLQIRSTEHGKDRSPYQGAGAPKV